MFDGADGKTLLLRGVTGFVAGIIGTYITRILVRIDEVWPVFHGKSFGPLVELLSQDGPLMLKACLIAGAIFAVFFVFAPRSFILSLVSAVLVMNLIVLIGRIYMAGGLQGAAQANALPLEAFIRATIRAVMISAAYVLLRPLTAVRGAGAAGRSKPAQ
jgi:hypothetical protein